MRLDLRYPIGLLLTTYDAILAIDGAIRATVLAQGAVRHGDAPI